MNRIELENYILENYQVSAEHPWNSAPDHEVFRHSGNRKWFAVIMDVPKCRLGLQDDGRMDVVNLKCDPILTGSLLLEEGFYPAYHMSKSRWISAALDGSIPNEKLEMLLDLSHRATAPTVRRKKSG